MRNRIREWVKRVVGVAILILLFASQFLQLTWPRFSEEREWFTSTSPYGERELRVTLSGDTFSFGAQDVEICGNGKHLFNDQISNDGKRLKEENYKVIWYENSALLYLSGEEKRTNIYHITFKGRGNENTSLEK